MSAQSSTPIDLADDVGDNIAMSLLSPRPAVAKTNNSAFETFHSPSNGGILARTMTSTLNTRR